MCRLLAELGEALAELRAPLAEACSASTSAPAAWEKAEEQLGAACTTIAACSSLAAIAGGMPASDSLRFCRAAELLLHVGRRSVGVWLQSAGGGTSRDAEPALDADAALLLVAERVQPQVVAMQALLAFLRSPGQEQEHVGTVCCHCGPAD